MSASSHKPTRWRRFLNDAAGVTAVEFGLLAPFFFLFVFGIAQIGLYFYYSAALTYATNAAARKILTGAIANTANITASGFRTNTLCPLLPGTMSCNNIITNIQTVPPNTTFTFNQSPPMDNTQTSFCIGQPGNYIVLQVYYAMPVLGLSWILQNATVFNGTPSVFINANSVFANEPFTTSYSGC